MRINIRITIVFKLGVPASVRRVKERVVKATILHIQIFYVFIGKRKYNPLANIKEEGCQSMMLLIKISIRFPCQVSNRSLRFRDTYQRGLNGDHAAWASKKN